MKKTKHEFIIFSFFICIIVIFGTSLSSYGKKYRLPNGRVLIDPYVLEKFPNGLSVGHKNGVMFIKFENLPAEIRKKYGYDRKKAEAYEKELEAKKKAYRKRKIAKAKEKKRKEEIYYRKRKAYNIKNTENRILKIKQRIQFLEKEISDLTKELDKIMQKTTQLAGTSVSGDHGRRVYNIWGYGYYTTSGRSAANRAENTKRKTIRKLEVVYAKEKKLLKKYKKELSDKRLELLKLEEKIKGMKSK